MDRICRSSPRSWPLRYDKTSRSQIDLTKRAGKGTPTQKRLRQFVTQRARTGDSPLAGYLFSIVFSITVLFVWEVVIRATGIPGYLLPAPSAIVKQIFLTRGFLIFHSIATGQAILWGFLLGSIFSITFAVVVVYVPVARQLFMPTVIFLQTMPKVALAPLFLVWIGWGTLTNVLITAMICFFPVLVNLIAGLDDVRRDEIRLMQSYNASKWQIFRHVQIYRALPYLFAGLKLASILAVTGAVVAEFVAGHNGLGFWVVTKYSEFRIPDMFAGILLLGIMGVVVYGIVDAVHRIMTPWQEKRDVSTGV